MAAPKIMTPLDRALLAVAPGWALSRMRSRAAARTLVRHYEAASVGRRTSGWSRTSSDANAANLPALTAVRDVARDLVRNNAWARRGLRVITNNTVGWGIVPKAVGKGAEKWAPTWDAWAGSTDCDADGRLTFYGLQALVLRSVAESGEVLVRRRRRRTEDGLAIPLQLQVMEPDFIDTSKDGILGPAGGPTIQGIEFDQLGRRVAYWLFDNHPGSNRLGRLASKRQPAEDIIHVYHPERAGQARGVSWFAPVVVALKDFDEFEDAEVIKQKMAACLAAYVTEADGAGAALGEPAAKDSTIETIEPGTVNYLQPGKDIRFTTPPASVDQGFITRTLRRCAAGLGVTYEDLTGDYSNVNFSSARMARIAHWANVHDWRWNMLIPQFCSPAWAWAMEAAVLAGLAEEAMPAKWTPPPMPMIEPDKEGLAYIRLVRAGAMTHDEMIREQGNDPETHYAEYAAGLKRLDDLGIWLDSDARRVSQAGLTQLRVGAGQASAAESAAPADT